MPWSDQGNGGKGPWGPNPGQNGRGGPRQQPPDFEDMIRKGQDRLKGLIPGGPKSPRSIMLIILILIAIWFASGFYRVLPDEQGVVTRFGEAVKTTPPGLHYHLPTPIEKVLTPKVTRVNREEIGFRSVSDFSRQGANRDVPEESLMLTGDENIVDIDFEVFWIIMDASDYLFNVQSQKATVKAAAETAMREIIGRTPIQSVLAEGRLAIESETLQLIQSILDSYQSGIQITNVNLQKVDPPGAVIDSFRDVQRARADLERKRNEAEAYQNDIIPRARGEAERLLQEAKAYKEEVVQRAQGDASRFLSIYEEYSVAKEVTTKRIYLETMERVLSKMNKIIIDQDNGSGVVPYLSIDQLRRTNKSLQGDSQ